MADDRTPKASLELPRPLTWNDGRQGAGQQSPVLDRGGEVTVQIPEALELFDPANGRSLDPHQAKGLGNVSLLFAPQVARPIGAGMREYAWISERLPKSINLNWRPYRPELPVDAVVDVSLSAGRARVRERLQFQFLQPPPPQVPLKVSGGLEMEGVEGGRFVGETDANGERDLILQTPVGKTHTITLEYLVPFPPAVDGEGHAVLIPVFQAQTATRGRTRLRIWCDADLQVSSPSKDWSVGPAEIVADRDSMPVLVLNGGLADAARLHLEPATHPAAAVLVDRILVSAGIGEDGAQSYRTRFVLQRLADHHLDLDFPVLLGRGSVVATLGGKRLPLTFLDAAGKPAEIGKTARLAVEPELYRQPVILDVSFEVNTERMEDPSRWHVNLRPVLLRNAVLLGAFAGKWKLPVTGSPCLPARIHARTAPGLARLALGATAGCQRRRPGAMAARELDRSHAGCRRPKLCLLEIVPGRNAAAAHPEPVLALALFVERASVVHPAHARAYAGLSLRHGLGSRHRSDWRGGAFVARSCGIGSIWL